MNVADFRICLKCLQIFHALSYMAMPAAGWCHVPLADKSVNLIYLVNVRKIQEQKENAKERNTEEMMKIIRIQ